MNVGTGIQPTDHATWLEKPPYPAPIPLNSGSAWHHPLSVLSQIILEGGGAYGGQMPAWKETLSEAEVYAAIASFQQYWSDKTYAGWLNMEKQSRQ